MLQASYLVQEILPSVGGFNISLSSLKEHGPIIREMIAIDLHVVPHLPEEVGRVADDPLFVPHGSSGLFPLKEVVQDGLQL